MEKHRILIVEDENLVAVDLEDRLARFGHTVTGIADNGVDAMRAVREHQPDLVLMDIKLLGPMDGIEVAAELRKEAKVPVVFLTSHADQRTVERACGTEPFGYIVKPFEDRDLLVAIETAIYRCRAEQRLRQMDHKLQEAHRLESLGVLASGVAHDFNNLLTAILANANLARADLLEDSPAQRNLQQIEIASLRAAELCQRMQVCAGKARSSITHLDTNALVAETVQRLQGSISRKAVIRLDLGSALPSLLADPKQLQQIITNLVVNASEALEGKAGIICIRTGPFRADRGRLAAFILGQDLPEGEYVLLEVSDTGCGMAQEVVQRIFDPFFSTKFPGRGLGLAAIYGIVKAHRGGLYVQSALGRGSVFRIIFPTSSAK